MKNSFGAVTSAFAMKKHFIKCILAGLVTTLPIAGLALMLIQIDRSLRPMVKGTPLDLPGLGIVVGLFAVYFIGLLVSSFIGRWLWSLIDRLLSALPGLAYIYNTLKQILGYGVGREAMFHRVVLVKTEREGAYEIGLVTEEVKIDGVDAQVFVFLPGSPNPANGRLILADTSKLVETKIPVDAAIKLLFTTGKSGWSDNAPAA